MSRRARAAKNRNKRHRVAVTKRSQSARTQKTEPPRVGPAPSTSLSRRQARSRPSRARQWSPEPHFEGVEPVRGLLSDRKAAAAAVDSEVNRLRRLGASWSDIGDALGVSRQAARQRYLTQS